jgi:hypothetical protein
MGLPMVHGEAGSSPSWSRQRKSPALKWRRQAEAHIAQWALPRARRVEGGRGPGSRRGDWLGPPPECFWTPRACRRVRIGTASATIPGNGSAPCGPVSRAPRQWSGERCCRVRLVPVGWRQTGSGCPCPCASRVELRVRAGVAPRVAVYSFARYRSRFAGEPLCRLAAADAAPELRRLTALRGWRRRTRSGRSGAAGTPGSRATSSRRCA